MTPAPIKTVRPETRMGDVVELLVDGGLNQLPVVSGNRLVGLLSRVDVRRVLQLREHFDLPPERAPMDERQPPAAA